VSRGWPAQVDVDAPTHSLPRGATASCDFRRGRSAVVILVLLLAGVSLQIAGISPAFAACSSRGDAYVDTRDYNAWIRSTYDVKGVRAIIKTNAFSTNSCDDVRSVLVINDNFSPCAPQSYPAAEAGWYSAGGSLTPIAFRASQDVNCGYDEHDSISLVNSSDKYRFRTQNEDSSCTADQNWVFHAYVTDTSTGNETSMGATPSLGFCHGWPAGNTELHNVADDAYSHFSALHECSGSVTCQFADYSPWGDQVCYQNSTTSPNKWYYHKASDTEYTVDANSPGSGC
jgi:hypothetical protein